MRPPKKKATAARVRNWRVSILRNRAEYLGTVAAADAEAAEDLAAETFKLDGERRKRLCHTGGWLNRVHPPAPLRQRDQFRGLKLL
jgi:hypothetical protein